MTESVSLERFLKLLRGAPTGGQVFNPWVDVDPAYDATPGAPRQRLSNLRRYLEDRLGVATHLFVAEAPGFRGCKFSGIAMTCERQLQMRTSCCLRLPKDADRRLGMLEPTASIVARVLDRHQIDPRWVVLWNTFAWHPHRAGNRLSNRTPTPGEVAQGLPVLRAMLALFSNCRVIAIGKTAQRTIGETLGMEVPSVRHPANGGASLFADQMGRILGGLDSSNLRTRPRA